MSLYIKLFNNFWTHRKTAKLRSIIGNDAYWLPPRLWSYASENQPDGDFSSYSPEELAMLLGYTGDATSMLKALQQASLMDGMKIHDWEDHNEYHHTFSERAKNAAKARWEKSTGEEKIREDKIRDKHCIKHATSILNPEESKIKQELNEMYHRRETTEWDPKEIKKLKEICRRHEYQSEMDEIKALYSNGYKFKRVEILTLLNNWSGELDRARRYKNHKKDPCI